MKYSAGFCAVCLMICCVIAMSQSSGAVQDISKDKPKPVAVEAEVVDQVEKALATLAKDAESQKRGRFFSQEAAFLLLRSLAAQGTELEPPKDGGHIFSIREDVRVEVYSNVIQDRAGSYSFHEAYLLRKKNGEWIICGDGFWVGDYNK